MMQLSDTIMFLIGISGPWVLLAFGLAFVVSWLARAAQSRSGRRRDAVERRHQGVIRNQNFSIGPR